MMAKEEKKVPNLRFKGFTDDWEQHKLEEMAEIVRGASPRPIKDKKWFDSNSTIGWIRISDVTTQNGRIYHLSQHISKLGQQKTRVVIQPHLLLSIAASVGYPVINYIPTGVHDGFLIFNNPKFNINYMFYWLRKYQTNWKKYGQPGSQVNLNSSIVSNTKVRLPSLDEQATISNIFYQIDKILSLHQRKLDLLKQLKKGFLQKMFAEKNSKQPVLRFKGFHDDWEQQKLGTYIIEYKKKTTKNNEFPVLTSSRKGIFFQKDYYDGHQVASKDNVGYNIVPYGYFTYRHMSDDNLFKFNINTLCKFGIVSTLYPVFTLNTSADKYFVYYYLNYGKEMQKFALIQKQGGSRTYMYLNKLRKLRFIVPLLSEQEKISTTLLLLDKLISLQQQKLAKYQSIKKSLLQQMFI